MGAAFYDLSFVQHDDSIKVEQRKYPMGDDNRSLMPEVGIQIINNFLLSLCVNRAQTVIKYQYFRIFNQSAGNRYSLFLTAAKGNSPLPDHGVVLVGKSLNFLVHAGISGRLVHQFHIFFIHAELDIAGNRITKEEYILRYIPHLAT